MAPWSVGGRYDRPLPRRIAEEAGLPRERFGVRNRATSHVHLTGPAEFCGEALADCCRFTEELHGKIAPWRVAYWRAQARIRLESWRRFGGRRKRYVRPSLLQRRIPFFANKAPIPIPWTFLHTFQWAFASLRGRYRPGANLLPPDR